MCPSLVEVPACQCVLIDQIRDNERAKFDRRHYESYSNTRKVGRQDGYVAALEDAVAAIKALHEPWILREPRQDGVYVLCAYCQTQFDAPYPCDTVKAIEALTGKSGDDK